MVNIPVFTRFYICQVVQDFFHQQYLYWNELLCHIYTGIKTLLTNKWYLWYHCHFRGSNFPAGLGTLGSGAAWLGSIAGLNAWHPLKTDPLAMLYLYIYIHITYLCMYIYINIYRLSHLSVSSAFLHAIPFILLHVHFKCQIFPQRLFRTRIHCAHPRDVTGTFFLHDWHRDHYCFWPGSDGSDHPESCGSWLFDQYCPNKTM